MSAPPSLSSVAIEQLVRGDEALHEHVWSARPSSDGIRHCKLRWEPSQDDAAQEARLLVVELALWVVWLALWSALVCKYLFDLLKHP